MTRSYAIVSSLTFLGSLMLGCGGGAPTQPPSTPSSSQAQAENTATEQNAAPAENAPAGSAAQPSMPAASSAHSSTAPMTQKPTATSTTPGAAGSVTGESSAESAPAEPKIPAGMVLVPAGSSIEAMLITPISTKDASEGMEVRAEVAGAIKLDGGLKAPIKRWRVIGQIVRIQKPEAKGDRPAELEIMFTKLRSVVTEDKHEYAIQGVLSEVGGATKGRNTGIMIGSAVAGAILVKKVGGDTKGAVLGAAAGAGIGAGVVRALPGQQITLEKNDPVTITLTTDAVLPVAEQKQP